MGPWLSWSLAATLALVAFSDGGYGAEGPNALPEAEDDPGKRDLEVLRIPRTTQRQRSRMTAYRTGSLSALSRGLMTNLSAPEKERGEKVRHERRASRNRDLCWGCDGTLLPSRAGSRESDSSKKPRSSQKSRDSDSLEVPLSHHNVTEDGEQKKASEWLPQMKRKG
ncbi:uncharacterized protein LOC144324985 [Podarcis muralis]